MLILADSGSFLDGVGNGGYALGFVIGVAIPIAIILWVVWLIVSRIRRRRKSE